MKPGLTYLLLLVLLTGQPGRAQSAGGKPSTIPACSRVININVHFILDKNGQGNFSEASDQLTYRRWDEQQDAQGQPAPPTHQPDSTLNGYAYARGLVEDMNYLFSTNYAQGGRFATVSVLEKKLRVTLNGVYFHRVTDEEFINHKDSYRGITHRNGVSDTVLFSRYGVARDSVINVFLAPNYTFQDTARRPSPSDVGGIAAQLGFDPRHPRNNWVKVFNSYLFYSWRRINEGNPNVIRGYVIPNNARLLTANTMCHELGHLFGLVHPFEGGNGCPDLDASGVRCADANLMSYCDAGGGALSPCQLEIVHGQLRHPAHPGVNDFTPYFSHTQAGCDEVPPRAFFRLLPDPAHPGELMLDARGCFYAQGLLLRLYRGARPRPGRLLGTQVIDPSATRPSSLSRLFRLKARRTYLVELVATGPGGASHSSRQVVRVGAEPHPPTPSPLGEGKPAD